MHKIAFLGDHKSLLLYRPAGFSLFTPESEADVRRLLAQLREEQCAIVFVTEQVYRMARKAIAAFNGGFLPAVVILPGYGENGQEGLKRIDELIENAVGTKL